MKLQFIILFEIIGWLFRVLWLRSIAASIKTYQMWIFDLTWCSATINTQTAPLKSGFTSEPSQVWYRSMVTVCSVISAAFYRRPNLKCIFTSINLFTPPVMIGALQQHRETLIPQGQRLIFSLYGGNKGGLNLTKAQ